MLNEIYEHELVQIDNYLKEQRIERSLPSLNREQKLALVDVGLMPSCIRILEYLFNVQQGARTDTLSRHCAVLNVSDVFMKNRSTLEISLGLTVVCETVKSKNRYDVKTVIGTWWVFVIDPDKWRKAEKKIAKKLANIG